MSTPLAERLVPPPRAPDPAPPPPPAPVRGATALLLAPLVLAGVTAFAGGGTTPGVAVVVEAGVALAAILAVALWAARTGLRSAASPVAWTGAGLLAALAIWCALTIPSSLAPDRSWDEANRVLAYALAVGVALAAGAAAPRAVGRAAGAWVAIATVVALFALAHKVAPGLLDEDGGEARLHEPLVTFGMLAALCALAAPVAVRLAAARGPQDDAPAWHGLAALGAAVVLLVALGLTWSRSGFLALAVGTLFAVGTGGDRLRALALLVTAAAGAAPALAYAWSREAITLEGATLDARIDDGRTLGLLILAGVALALIAGFAVLRATRSRAHRRGLKGWVVVVVAGGVLVAACAATLASEWDTFTDPVQTSPAEPDRLTATDSGNRWALWEEAAGAWDDHPLDGWGAGTFAVNHLRYRQDEVPATQAFSMPMDLLAETGLIGLALALAALGCLGWAAVSRLRALAPGDERDVGGALAGVGAAALVLALVEPLWEVPAVAVPALVLPAVVAARPSARARAPMVAPAFADPEAEPGAGRRPWGRLAFAALVLGAVAVSAILPAWSSALRTSAAETAADVRSDGQELEAAASDARLAADLNPAAAAPLETAAAVAERRTRLLDARTALLEAAGRQPDRAATWEALAELAARLADREGAQAAARRTLELDPMSSERRALARRAEAGLAPPESSATATGTPLPAVP